MMNTMKKTIVLDGVEVEYTYTVKKVKNINLRIKPDGSVHLSANRYVAVADAEKFMLSRKKLILDALNKFKNAEKKPLCEYFDEKGICDYITARCGEIYPYFEKKGVSFPLIRFKKLTSKWGSCHTKKGILTFNTNLMYAPKECVDYVIYHEYTHFLVPNHSAKFYDELSKVCPDWKVLRKRIKEISLR